ncbi:hypothetical protein GCM10008101_27810 [Lysobacter xinjiangensis]|uniref:Uncharacterized protein n=1 Tax=Cognatilysobacter xinjiangensis TaxID=546892 RepID=A0ABQ3CAE6_9GAMM|nr:hypothetical protein GCM10008101_27810 [Lysobacter xinjiangensis]
MPCRYVEWHKAGRDLVAAGLDSSSKCECFAFRHKRRDMQTTKAFTVAKSATMDSGLQRIHAFYRKLAAYALLTSTAYARLTREQLAQADGSSIS